MKPEDIKRLEDKFDHAILLARQSTPDSLSPILSGIKRDLARIEGKVDEMIAATGAALAIILGCGKQTLIQWLRQ